MTDIQALVLGIRKECSWRKLAAGDTTVGSTPTLLVPINCDAISAMLGKYPTIDVRHF